MSSESMDEFEKSGVMDAFLEENIRDISQGEMNRLFPPSIFEDFMKSEQGGDTNE